MELDQLDLWNSIMEFGRLELQNSIKSIYGTQSTRFMELNQPDLRNLIDLVFSKIDLSTNLLIDLIYDTLDRLSFH